MAIPSIHEAMTREAMRGFGFPETSRDIAAAANALVDEKQSNDAAEANLHSMCGFILVPFGAPEPAGTISRLQTADECRIAVNALLELARRESVEHILAARYRPALERIGQAHHTVQDRAFHNFEPWPYRGIGDAILNNPNYMFAHGLRDLGAISRLQLAELPATGRFDVEANRRVGRRVYLGLRFFNNPVDQDAMVRPAGRDTGSGDGFLGAGGMVTFTFGAAPGSQPPIRRAGSDPEPEETPPTVEMMTRGPESRTRAEDASAEYIEQVRRQISAIRDGAAAWEQFTRAQIQVRR